MFATHTQACVPRLVVSDSVPLILALSRVSVHPAITLLSRRSLGIRSRVPKGHGHAYWHPIYLYCFLSTMAVISCLTLSANKRWLAGIVFSNYHTT
ncbi:hypothetical protein V8E55_008258 [Tylopilus felleus]